MKFILCLLLPLLLAATPEQPALGASVAAPALPTLVSPNKLLRLQFGYDPAGALTYTFSAQAKVLLHNAQLGLQQPGPVATPSVLRRSVDAVWKPVWGKRAMVPEQYNELTLDLKTYKIIARAYNNGIAFRYAYPAGQAVAERTTFAFAGNYTAWYYNGEKHNLGPENLADCDGKRLPVMTVRVDSITYLALHEADLGSGDPLVLQAQKGSAVFTIASQPTTSWKVVLYGQTPGDLVDSQLLELLNPAPAQGQDFSWVKLGVALWDWRTNGAQANGFTYSMSLPSWKRLVDFAAANKLPYLVLDADWYGPEFSKDSDPTKGGKVRFIAAQKMPWLASKTVRGEIGQYIVMVRQAQDQTWLVGAAINEQARELVIPLTFLGPGRYAAAVVQDGPQADYRTQRESYTTDTRQVGATDVLQVKLAPGGGACVLLKPN